MLSGDNNPTGFAAFRKDRGQDHDESCRHSEAAGAA